MSNKNLHTPPPGVQPNLQDPEDRAYRIYIVAGISLVLIQVFAGGRCYAKKRILQWKKDDCKCIFDTGTARLTLPHLDAFVVGLVRRDGSIRALR